MPTKEEATTPVAASATLPDSESGHRELAHANRLALLGRCVAMIVHDALQPVASVVTRGQSTLRWLRHDPPDVDRAIASLERLVADAQRAGTVLAELRALASPTARQPEALSLDGLLRDTLHWLDDDLRRHGIAVEQHPHATELCVMAERAALHQLFVNLVVNAIEAMSDTPPAARALTVHLRAEGPDAVVSIGDRGCGISGEAASRLFDAFYTTKDEGMGIGLAICHRIVIDHGGSIRAEARTGGGATFEVRLPRYDQAASCSAAR